MKSTPPRSPEQLPDVQPSSRNRDPDGGAESPFPEPVALPINGVLDLHTIGPRDTQVVVEEYLRECYRQNIGEIRVIHGKGIGAQREMVRKLLARLDFVDSFGDAPMEAGGWGATLVTLKCS